MQRAVLIVTNSRDEHADEVQGQLARMGQLAVRLDTDRVPGQTGLALTPHDPHRAGSISLSRDGQPVALEQVGAVWLRRPGSPRVPEHLSAQEKQFAELEIRQCLYGMLHCLDVYWMSHPARIFAANYKIEQLKRAARMGFSVPTTLVTDNPAKAREFYDACGGEMIYKVLSDAFLAADKVDQEQVQAVGVGTTLIAESHVEHFDAIEFAPCLFQKYVAKKYELRVTVIGDEVFAAEIHSQADPRTRIDWRNYDVSIPWRRARLPSEIEERCLRFVHSYGLTFSAMDLIVTPEQEYVFVENNPMGQFIFVERLIPELRMTAALAARLQREANA